MLRLWAPWRHAYVTAAADAGGTTSCFLCDFPAAGKDAEHGIVWRWQRWYAIAGAPCPTIRGPVFDSSLTIAAAAIAGIGVAMLPIRMCAHDLSTERRVRPFEAEAPAGGFWVSLERSRAVTWDMQKFLLELMEEWGVSEEG